MNDMRIAIVGGGPAGLYLSLLLKTWLPACAVDVFEQNPPGATYGFGIVLADRGLEYLRRAHAPSATAIESASYVTRHRLVRHRSETIFIEEDGYGLAIARLRLLEILGDFCRRSGVRVQYETPLHDVAALNDWDLIVGADGAHSIVRRADEAEFGSTFRTLTNRIAWYGTKRHFTSPVLAFKSNARGHFVGVGYPYSESASTFVAECDRTAWETGGVGSMTDGERTALAETIFRDELGGSALISNRSLWRPIPVVRNARWSVGNRVLIGDALQSAHPSIGSGTRIAMEDAIVLARAVASGAPSIAEMLQRFEAERRPARQKLLDAMERSIDWYENVGEHASTSDSVSLVFDYMTRTGRITEERLRAGFPRFMQRYESEWRAFQADRAHASRAPAF
jgi:2-polyprenyl-6-methoxyphenol hydroxylase-like FAD-dependent oxidoreductase